MSNHLQVVLSVEPELARAWTDDEVADTRAATITANWSHAAFCGKVLAQQRDEFRQQHRQGSRSSPHDSRCEPRSASSSGCRQISGVQICCVLTGIGLRSASLRIRNLVRSSILATWYSHMKALRAIGVTLCALAAAANANQIDRVSSVPAYSGTTAIFVVIDSTLVGCGWPGSMLSEMDVSESRGEILVSVEAKRTGEICLFSSVPFHSQLAIPLAEFLGVRQLGNNQRIRVRLVNEFGSRVESSVTLNSAPSAPVLPQAGAWIAEYGTRLWLDMERGGLTLAFSSDDIGDADPLYEWPQPGRGVSWKGATSNHGFAEVRFESIAPVVVDGEVGRFPRVGEVQSGYVAFSDPFNGFIALPSGVVTAVSKRQSGGTEITLGTSALGTRFPSLSGEWIWVAEASPLLGRRTRLTLVDQNESRVNWKLETPGTAGGGKIVCEASGDCVVYLSSRFDSVAAPIFRFAVSGIGDRTLIVGGEPVAHRTRY